MAKSNAKPNNLGLKQLYGTLVGAIMLLLGIGILLAANQPKIVSGGNTTEQNPLQQVITADPEHPSETSIDPNANYQVPYDMPRRIMIEAPNIKGFIQQVGLNSRNALSVPSNIHLAGWYNGSVKPGEAGLSIIDGHVSGVSSDGVFKQLGQLRPGSRFSIEYGDRSTRTFEVVETKSLPEARSSSYLFNKWDTIPEQLNLITCGGKFDKATQTYSDRIVVVSRRVDE